jgi:hypothetical protein
MRVRFCNMKINVLVFIFEMRNILSRQTHESVLISVLSSSFPALEQFSSLNGTL